MSTRMPVFLRQLEKSNTMSQALRGVPAIRFHDFGTVIALQVSQR